MTWHVDASVVIAVQVLTARAYSSQLVTLDVRLIERVQNSELAPWVVHLNQT